MSSSFGNTLKISIFGGSHGKAIGVVADGFPTGEEIDEDELYRFMSRRKPGSSSLTTQRSEKDSPIFLSGVENGKTSGSPLCAIIENGDTRSGDYSEFWDKPRPSHADYTARMRYGDDVDMRGSGHFSGRLTAPLCIAGGIAKQILARRGIYVGAHLKSIGNVEDTSFPLYPTSLLFEDIVEKPLPVIDNSKIDGMTKEINDAKDSLDSIGGTIECAIIGVRAGIGSPMFDGVENRLARAIFGIPAIKGLEFGAGFAAAKMRGSQHNDPYIINNGTVKTEKNDHGGAIGGITSGMPIVFRVAVKPTPSISKEQRTVNLSTMEETTLTITGRHDPCIALRAVPVVEAVAACAILDLLLEENENGSY